MTDFTFDDEKKAGTNRRAAPTRCKLCGGDRFVTVRLRSPEQTVWMEEHQHSPRKKEFYEEVAPCPDCHPIEVSYFRHGDKVPFRTMDPALVRQFIAGPL